METGSAPFREEKTEHEVRQTKTCMYCGERRSASEFRRRTGRRARSGARRGACRRCRQNGMDHNLREDMTSSSAVKNEREGNDRIASYSMPGEHNPGHAPEDMWNHVN